MPFLRNAWYVAAWDDEVPASEMFRRRILNDDILLIRDGEGAVHALLNRCPHRFAPLHAGKRRDDVIECAYHGLQFGMDGACVFNPHGDGKLPPNAQVKQYPLIAKDMLLWIWMGDPEKADPADFPDMIGLDPDRYAIHKGYLHTPVNYELMTDNIMDLGHIEFVHEGLLGSEAVRKADLEVRRDGDTVHSLRLTHDEILPSALEALYQSGGEPVNRWLDVVWRPPANMQLVVGVARTDETPRASGREAPGVHLMTPETETSTHYFWSNSRDFRRDDHELHEQLEQGLRYAFEQQDKPMIQAQQDAMNGEEYWDLKPVMLACDAGAVQARRILQQLIQKEEQADA